MITVTVTRHYPEATNYTCNESGVLRIWNGLDCIARYEKGIEHTVSYTPASASGDRRAWPEGTDYCHENHPGRNCTGQALDAAGDAVEIIGPVEVVLP